MIAVTMIIIFSSASPPCHSTSFRRPRLSLVSSSSFFPFCLSLSTLLFIPLLPHLPFSFYSLLSPSLLPSCNPLPLLCLPFLLFLTHSFIHPSPSSPLPSSSFYFLPPPSSPTTSLLPSLLSFSFLFTFFPLFPFIVSSSISPPFARCFPNGSPAGTDAQAL